MINVEQQERIFLEIAKKLPHPITVYAIGGTAMMFQGLKGETLDIDIVFTKEEDRQDFKTAVKSLGFEDFDTTIVYGKNKNAPDMVKLPDSRIDLFLNNVLNFVFSESIRNRAAETHQFAENLIIKVADVHDLIVMKCATTRPKDEQDIVKIIRNAKINWNILVREAEEQIKLGNESAVLTLGTILEKLSNKYKLPVPSETLDSLWSLLEKQVKFKARKRSKR